MVAQYERPYYYNKQLRRWIVQFMAVFGGFQVMVGWNEDKEPRLIPVPIANGSKDRVVAWIKNQQTQNQMIRLPLLSATLTGLDMSPQLRKGVGQQRRNVVAPTGGLIPDDVRVVQQRMPVPYMATFELGIWTSNQDQHYQLIEQITSLFDPTMSIQSSDDVLDWTRLSSLELKNIRFDENVPPGLDRRTIQTYMDFEVPIWMSIPTDVHKRFVEQIFMRVGVVSTSTTESEDIIQELNDLGIQYEEIFNINDVDIENDPSDDQS